MTKLSFVLKFRGFAGFLRSLRPWAKVSPFCNYITDNDYKCITEYDIVTYIFYVIVKANI